MSQRPRTLLVVGCLLFFGLFGCNLPNQSVDRQSAAGTATSRDATAKFDLPDISIVSAEELELVEQVLSHRASYHRKLRQLCDYYGSSGYEFKRRWADFELTGFEKVKPYAYVEQREVPAEALAPVEQIAEADTLYDRGLDLMRQGGHGLPVLYRLDVLADAYKTFVSLVEQYPSSDKIDDAAFQCGEILKECFPGREAHAVRWYERAFAWDEQTPHPARFRAAVLYDHRLADRARALALYRRIIALGTGDKSNLRYCQGRIEELTTAQPPSPTEGTGAQQSPLFGSPDTTPRSTSPEPEQSGG